MIFFASACKGALPPPEMLDGMGIFASFVARLPGVGSHPIALVETILENEIRAATLDRHHLFRHYFWNGGFLFCNESDLLS